MDSSRASAGMTVELIKVGKSYPPDVRALDEVSLSVGAGEMLFLTGRSGAGKTTLLRMLCRIETPDQGLVEVDGTDLGRLNSNDLQQLRRRIGMAYQDFKLLPERSVARNIGMALEVCYRKKSFIRTRTRHLLERLGLGDKSRARAGDLSRGEQQRVALARALANDPDLILADEPTGNLDAETTRLVMDLFHEHHRRGTTILIATHDPSIFADSGHRVIELIEGRIREGSPPVRQEEES